MTFQTGSNCKIKAGANYNINTYKSAVVVTGAGHHIWKDRLILSPLPCNGVMPNACYSPSILRPDRRLNTVKVVHFAFCSSDSERFSSNIFKRKPIRKGTKALNARKIWNKLVNSQRVLSNDSAILTEHPADKKLKWPPVKTILFLAHLSTMCSLGAFWMVQCPSCVFSNFFKHLLPNHLANLDQTWQECSLGGPLSQNLISSKTLVAMVMKWNFLSNSLKILVSETTCPILK